MRTPGQDYLASRRIALLILDAGQCACAETCAIEDKFGHRAEEC